MSLFHNLAIAATLAGIALASGTAPVSESLGPSSRRTALVISEIMYHPAPRPDGLRGEFIELHNTQPWAEDISGFRFTGAIDFEFPPGTSIPAGGFLVLAESPAGAEAIYAIDNVLGPYQGRLSNGGENIRLRNPAGAVLLEVPYKDVSPWPVAADGLGHSLVLAAPSLSESNPLAWSPSRMIHGSPGADEEPAPNSLDALVINEVQGHPTRVGEGYVELFNRGGIALDLGGAELSVDHTARFVFPAGTMIAPGGWLVVGESESGLPLDGRDFLLALTDPERTRVLDAVRYSPHAPAMSFGRTPDGSVHWKILDSASPGSENSAATKAEVIFNELMFHPISGLAADEYIEIYNRTPGTIELGGWQINGGIEFAFPEGTEIPPSSYLVVAKDVERLRRNHPHLNAANSLGNYDGVLSDGGESLRLLRPAEWHFPGDPADTPTLLVDEVSYLDESRWSRWADGGGSSLELIDSAGDNDLAANWGDSDESQKSAWTEVEVTAEMPQISGLSPRSFEILLLGAGEMLVDEVELVGPGLSNRVRNGGFESTSNWVFQGNHESSEFSEAGGAGEMGRALLVRAAGRGDTHSNRIRQTISSGLSDPGQATIRAQVRWLRGHSEVLFRLHGNFMEAVGAAKLPSNLGSPGLANSRSLPNAPPVISEVAHAPVLPGASESVVVTTTVTDVDGVGSVMLNYRVDVDGGTSATIAMLDDGAAPDEIARDGIYAATIPGQPGGRLVAFHIVAEDGQIASPATGTFPPDVPAGECLVRFGDGAAPSDFGDYRIWFTRETHSDWVASSRVKASNEPLDVTFVYNGERVVYNVGATYSGSFFNSPDYTGPTGTPCDYAFRFPGGEEFLGASRVILSWLGLTGTPDNTAQHEQFSYWLASQLGLPFNHRRYVTVQVNGVRRGTVMEDTQRPNSDMLRQWFPGDSDGELFKTQIRYEGNDSATEPVLVSEATLQRLGNPDGGRRTADYRWNWSPQAIGNSVNRFDRIFELTEVLDTTDDTEYTNSVRSLVDIDQWMRTFALEHIVGNWDSYGYGNSQNMYAYKPVDGRWELMIWDLDIGSGSSLADVPTRPLFALTNVIFPVVDGDPEIVGRMYENPEFVRSYWRALEEAATGPMGADQVSAYLDPKYEALRASFGAQIRTPGAIKTYVERRRDYILQQLDANVASEFAIVSPASLEIETDSTPLIIRGHAPVSVQTIMVNGVPV
ncbi:MAG: lamin tail domain-containing protein, partial [Verrucomicrobiales bacterium]